ncbi:MAG: ABC transporter permease [Clostridiales bacterium]|nr:ABC transporter permease [Clostridiales bacterium]
MSKKFANTRLLMGFISRRDRIRLPMWILGITIFTISIAALLPDLYTGEAEKTVLAETMKNPAITFMIGSSAGLDNYTDGAMMGHFMLVFTAIFVAIMNILLMTRHTREDEEEGRIEMINSLPVGSLSNLTAASLILLISNIIIFLLVGLGLYVLGIETIGLKASLLFAASISLVGIFYAGLTGLLAQLTSNVRATLGFSFVFLISEYIIRGLGDIANSPLSYITPLGLITRSEVYVNNHWWPVLVLLLVSILVFILAFYLNSIRDLGAGFISTKPGNSQASKYLGSQLGLALRLERTPFIAWTAGMLILGIAYGSLLGELEGFLSSSPLVQKMIPSIEGMSLSQSFITMLITILSVLASVPVIMFVLKLNSEEKKNRINQLLATPISRNKLMGSYTFIGLVSSLVMQLTSSLGLWSAALFVMEEPVSLKVLLKASYANLPAMWIFIGVATFLIGWLPRLTSLTWAFLIYSFFVEYMGEMLKLPEWMANLSPFHHIPSIPAENIKISTLLLIAGIAAILIATGFVGYNRRDIE